MTRPLLTIVQVVEQFNISRATVRRNIESGKFSDAVKDDQGRWLVPVNDLVGAGVKPRKTWLNEVAGERAQGLVKTAQNVSEANQTKVASERAQELNELALERAKVALLEAQLEAEKRLRESAERNADDLRNAMRMIESGRPDSIPESSIRRRWWKRN